jgi:UrcA family protein
MNSTHYPPTADAPFIKLALMTLCATGLVAAIAAQQPASADNAATATVSVADIDISTPGGMRAARDRLQATARRLCLQVADPKDRSSHDNFLACMDKTMTAALQQLQRLAPAALAKAQEPKNP